MKLDFKGIITKEALEKDINNLDEIMNENDYAIVVENGVGKFVIFDMDYVKYRLELKDEYKSRNKLKKSPFTLVESMIQTLEELPEKKTTAIMLSSLVEKYYGKKVSPVIIRTRAEENANNKGNLNVFYIEPENVIGLMEGISFEAYINIKNRAKLINKIERLFISNDKLDVSNVVRYCRTILKGKMFNNFTDEKYVNYILALKKYRIEDNYLLKRRN